MRIQWERRAGAGGALLPLPFIHHASLGRHVHARLGFDVFGDELMGGCVTAEDRQAARAAHRNREPRIDE